MALKQRPDADRLPVETSVPSSAAAPVAVPVMTGASSAPVTVTVTDWLTDSPSGVVATTVKVSAAA